MWTVILCIITILVLWKFTEVVDKGIESHRHYPVQVGEIWTENASGIQVKVLCGRIIAQEKCIFFTSDLDLDIPEMTPQIMRDNDGRIRILPMKTFVKEFTIVESK